MNESLLVSCVGVAPESLVSLFLQHCYTKVTFPGYLLLHYLLFRSHLMLLVHSRWTKLLNFSSTPSGLSVFAGTGSAGTVGGGSAFPFSSTLKQSLLMYQLLLVFLHSFLIVLSFPQSFVSAFTFTFPVAVTGSFGVSADFMDTFVDLVSAAFSFPLSFGPAFDFGLVLPVPSPLQLFFTFTFALALGLCLPLCPGLAFRLGFPSGVRLRLAASRRLSKVQMASRVVLPPVSGVLPFPLPVPFLLPFPFPVAFGGGLGSGHEGNSGFGLGLGVCFGGMLGLSNGPGIRWDRRGFAGLGGFEGRKGQGRDVRGQGFLKLPLALFGRSDALLQIGDIVRALLPGAQSLDGIFGRGFGWGPRPRWLGRSFGPPLVRGWMFFSLSGRALARSHGSVPRSQTWALQVVGSS